MRIPKQFFKVFAYRQGDRVQTAAFIVTQEDLLATIDRYYEDEKAGTLTELEVRLYQVPIRLVSKLTGLDFGAIQNVEKADEALDVEALSPIESSADLQF